MTNNQYKLLFSIRNKTIELLKGYGNEPSEQHELAIEKLASQISFIAYSNIPIRLAAPLETGMGKTTTIIAALLCMENTDRSALVCVETLDQQRELHEACINAGISSNKIARFHKVVSEQQNHPCIRQEEASLYQFLIVCHNKLYSDSKKISKDPLDEISVNWMNTFNGEERSIVFWDERLEPKSCFTLFKSEIRSALGAWLPLYEEKIATKTINNLRDDQAATLRNLGEWLKEVNHLLTNMTNNGLLSFPQLDITNQDAKICLEYVSCLREGSERDNKNILELIKFNQIGIIRLIKANNRDSLIQFQTQIHSEFRKLVIFDATLPIRELSKYDRTIEIMDIPIRKSYKNVVIHICPTYSSKNHLTGKQKSRNLESYYQEIDQLLHHEIPQSEEVLLFTFKGILEEVKNHFNQDKYFHRVHVTHWGMHKASNRYSHIKYMATLGIMRRNAADLIANILGAKDDIGSTVTAKELQAVEHTEMADMLIQAIGRGHNRVTKSGGIAGDTAIWLYLPEKDRPVIDSIQQAMTGVALKERKRGKYFEQSSKRSSKTEFLANQIDNVLSQHNTEQITIEDLRGSFIPRINSQDKPWHRGLARFLKDNEQWIKKGKALYLRQ